MNHDEEPQSGERKVGERMRLVSRDSHKISHVLELGQGLEDQGSLLHAQHTGRVW